MRKLTVLLVFFLLAGMQVVFAQRAVTGRVVTTDNTPLPGVTVVVQGTTTGTVTDPDGGFTLQVPNNQAVLQFSFVGFNSQNVTVGTQTAINITLTESAEQLSEVVVTALGIRREAKSLGYAVSTVGSDVLTENRSVSAIQSLEGRVAGLNISTTATGAGGSSRILLRGQSGFEGATNSPLIVINGLPMDQGARSATTGNNARDRGDALNNINPDDIETMTVLRGATAAAIYGSRAANGAILITTKSGSGAGQAIGVEVTSSLTTQNVLDFFDFQDQYGIGTYGERPSTVGQVREAGAFNWGVPYDGQPSLIFDGTYLPYQYYGKNRIKDYFRTGTTFTNTVAMSGSTAKGSFRASYSNSDTKGIDPTNEYKRNTVNVGISNEILPNVRFSLNINYANEVYVNPPRVGIQGQGPMNFLTRITLSVPLYKFKESATDPETGTEAVTSGWPGTVINPYYARSVGQYWGNTRDRLLGTATLRYDITDWLWVQGRYNYDYSLSYTEAKEQSGIAISDPKWPDGTYRGSYDVSETWGREVNADFLLGFDKRFDRLSVNVNLGGNTYRISGHTFEIGSSHFIAQDFFSIANGTSKTQSYSITQRRVNSLYGTAEVGYNSTFYLNFTGRNDWFSVLNPANNDQFYPSVSGSIVFSELLKKSWLNYGKLRGSWAKVGSANGVGTYEGLLTYTIPTNAFNGQPTATISGNLAPNPNLAPFTVEEKEIGLEMRMLRNKLYVDIAAFDKVSSGQIMNVQLSTSSGYNTTRQNVGSLRNRGLETMIEYRPINTGDFSWTTSWNNTWLATKVLSVGYNPDGSKIQEFLVVNYNDGGGGFLGALYYTVGKSMNQLYSRTYLRNENGDIVLRNNGALLETTDYVPFGTSTPKHTGGWNNTFTYKNLTASIFFDYKFGGRVISATNLNLTREGFTQLSLEGRRIYSDGTVQPGLIFPGVIPDYDGVDSDGNPILVGYHANDQIITVSGLDANGNPAYRLMDFYTDYRNIQIGDPFIHKTDFIKLRSISLSYDLTNSVSKVDFLKFVKGLSVSASCRNVAILYKDIPNLDPEAIPSSGDIRAGYENVSLPTTRSFIFSLNVKF